MSNLTLDLDFSTPEPPITCPADIPSEWLVAMEDMINPPELTIEQHRAKMVKPEPDVKSGEFYSTEIFSPHAKRLGLDHHMYAFIAQAKHHGLSDPALVPVYRDDAGRAIYEEAEVARFANELLRGVRSDRPVMTPERWAEASAKAREKGGKK